ncbi:hypothetical protein LXL04_017965 [Taraxacum kok-saghyz]
MLCTLKQQTEKKGKASLTGSRSGEKKIFERKLSVRVGLLGFGGLTSTIKPRDESTATELEEDLAKIRTRRLKALILLIPVVPSVGSRVKTKKKGGRPSFFRSPGMIYFNFVETSKSRSITGECSLFSPTFNDFPGYFENSYISENPRTPPTSYISQTVFERFLNKNLKYAHMQRSKTENMHIDNHTFDYCKCDKIMRHEINVRDKCGFVQYPYRLYTECQIRYGVVVQTFIRKRIHRDEVFANIKQRQNERNARLLNPEFSKTNMDLNLELEIKNPLRI